LINKVGGGELQFSDRQISRDVDVQNLIFSNMGFLALKWAFFKIKFLDKDNFLTS